ncbi:elongation of very long chain fatty acids protein-like, partial [Aplysia californica]|uniref:Elongation of very long chain fatty acids protein n=1 Tax=Aplysia californica TaxID=6500 RepID=A0ABM1W4R0_APLCA
GFGTFHSLLNSWIHFMMYMYYGLSAMGPAFQKYLWWKKYMTTMQITQFASVIIHASQLLFMECDYPIFFVYMIGFYSFIFFVMFGNFYVQSYLKPKAAPSKQLHSANGSVADHNKAKTC